MVFACYSSKLLFIGDQSPFLSPLALFDILNMIYCGLKPRVRIDERRCTLWGIDIMSAMIISMRVPTIISTMILMAIALLAVVSIIVLIIVLADATGSGTGVAGVANAGLFAISLIKFIES